MTSSPRALRVLGYAGAIFVGIVLVFVVINQFDQEFDPAAAAFYESGRTPPLAEKSGFAMVVGFGSPVDEDPRKFAVAWSGAMADAYRAGKPSPIRKNALELRASPELLCLPERANCIDLYRKNPRSVDETALDNAVLLRRYSALQREANLSDAGVLPAFDAPVADYSPILAAQTLYLSQVAVQAGRGDLDGAIRQLEADAAFLRRWLAQGHLLISKMVVLRALSRDILMAMQVAREIATPSEAQASALRRIAAPLGPAEWAIGRAMRFEATVLPDALERAMRDRATRRATFGVEPLAELLVPLTLRNATLNFAYRPYSIWEGLDGVESRNLAVEIGKVQRSVAAHGSPDWTWFYNPGGKILVTTALPEYSIYLYRLRDLDALARLVCATLDVRWAAVPVESVGIYLAKSDSHCHDPYTGKPFAWDAASGSLWFKPRWPESGVRFGGSKDRVATQPLR